MNNTKVNEVFGVNAARVQNEVCHLIEVYKKYLMIGIIVFQNAYE